MSQVKVKPVASSSFGMFLETSQTLHGGGDELARQSLFIQEPVDLLAALLPAAFEILKNHAQDCRGPVFIVLPKASENSF